MRNLILNRFGFWLLCLMLLFASCSKEQLADNSYITTGSPVEMRLQVKAPLGSTITDNENSINRLRMVIFGSIGSPDAGKLILNKYYATVPAGNDLKEMITSGKRDIYIIVNEPHVGGAELDRYKNIATVADIGNLSLRYGGVVSIGIYIPKDIPMFAKFINKSILVDAQNEIIGDVERVMAKVTMKLNVKRSNFPTGKHVVIDKIQIQQLPFDSYWIARNYTDMLMFSEIQDATTVVPAESGYDFSFNNTFYVPEYIFNDPESGAYIDITGYVNGEPTRICKWSVKLGDAMDDAKQYGDRYTITRNRHYTFIGDVKTYGQMDNLAVKVTVLPWNMVNQDDGTGRFVVYNKVTDAVDNPIADGANLDDMGTTLKVVCNTNIGVWYTVTRDMKGFIVHKSAPTASVSSATPQTVNITIPKLAELVYGQNYTVSIYQPTIVMESVGPVKVLNFTQRGGFIPNSVLSLGFTAGGITYSGWPADKLPPNGLQLAKRGDRKLPGGVAGTDDSRMAWKTTDTSTAGTAEGLGMGKSSTDAMKGVEHPAAEYCREMGDGWFLPSKAEWLLIYNNRSTLGISYTLAASYYWSATEASSNASWYVNLSNGTVNSNIRKTNNFRVRCVRYI